MKATLEFDLTDRDDEMAHMRCIKALDMALVLWHFTHNLRKTMECELKCDEETENAVFKELYDLFEEYDINIDNLVE